MEQENLQIVAAGFPRTFEARAALTDLKTLDDHGAIELVDAAILIKQRSGKLEITDTADLTPKKGSKRGAVIGAVIGAAFPPAILASTAIGAAAGAAAGRLSKGPMDDAYLGEFGEVLPPGSSAIIALVEGQWVKPVTDTLEARRRPYLQLGETDAHQLVVKELPPGD